MGWSGLDIPTRVGFLATVMAVLTVLIPPIGLASAVAAIVFSGVALARARHESRTNSVARWCLAVSAGLVVLVVVGSAIYASLD